MQGYLGTVVCKFGGDPVIFMREEVIFVTAQKCQYHVTFDLDLDLEHTLDAGLPGQWAPSYASLVAIRSFSCERAGNYSKMAIQGHPIQCQVRATKGLHSTI